MTQEYYDTYVANSPISIVVVVFIGLPLALYFILTAKSKPKMYSFSGCLLSGGELGWFVLIASVIFIVGSVISHNKPETQKSTPDYYVVNKTATPNRAISVQPTKVFIAQPTKIYFTPTTPRSNCINWAQISPSMVGQEICIYGTVYSLYATEQATTRIKFTSKPNTFFIYNSIYVFPDLRQGDCVVAKEILQLFDNTIPYMAASELYHCESWMK